MRGGGGNHVDFEIKSSKNTKCSHARYKQDLMECLKQAESRLQKKKRREKAEYDANEPKATLPSHRLRGLKAFLLVG